MLKKSLKPQTNSYICIKMMMVGAKKRRDMAYATVRALDGESKASSNVVMFK